MSRRVWFIHLRPWPYNMATAIVLAFASPLFADAYTNSLKGEANKIDAGHAAATTDPEGAGSDSQDPVPPTFERELDQRYHGAYLFYKRLPTHSQEEILQAHDNGASIDEIRNMVMERFLRGQ